MTRRSSSATVPIPTLLASGIRGWRPEMRCSSCARVESACECRTVIAGPALAADVTQEFSLTSADLTDLYFAERAGETGSR